MFARQCIWQYRHTVITVDFGGSQFGRKLKIATVVGQVGQSEVERAFEGIESSLLKSKKEIPLEGMIIC